MAAMAGTTLSLARRIVARLRFKAPDDGDKRDKDQQQCYMHFTGVVGTSAWAGMYVTQVCF